MRRRVEFNNPDGTRLTMIADSSFVHLLSDYERAVKGGQECIETICRGLERYPIYVRAFENMLEREENPERKRLLEMILLEYEFLSAFNLFEQDGEGF